MLITYDTSLIIISVLIATFTSYTALGFGHRIISSTSANIRYWIIGGGLVMGIGVWSMHFIGMLAAKMPMEMAYDPLITGISILPAIVASMIALYTLSKGNLKRTTVGIASILMGSGIAGMHYIGMAAMKMQPAIEYNIPLLLLSLLIAIIASGAALLIIARLDNSHTVNLRGRKFISSLIMGAAISGMHYTGMSAAVFSADSICLAAPSGIHADTLALLVTGFAAATLLLALVILLLDSLQGQNRFYRTLLDAQSDVGEGIILLEDMKLVFCNSAVEKLSNYSRADILSLPSPIALFSPEQREDIQRQILLSQQSPGTNVRMEAGLISKEGYRLETELALSSFQQGEHIRTLIVCLDITDKKHAIENLRDLNQTLEKRVADRTTELQEQHEFIETILNIAGALVIVLDREGRVVRFNQACENLSTYRLAEIQGKHFWDYLIPDEYIEQAKSVFAGQISSAQSTEYQAHWKSHNNTQRLIAWTAATLTDQQGNAQYVIRTGIDITEQKQSEHALLQANKELYQSLETLREAQDQLVHAEKMASLGSLVAGISHEINTPLGISVTSATNLEEELHKLNSAFQQGSMKRSMLENFLHHSNQVTDILLQNIRRASELIANFKQVAVDQSNDAWRTIELREYVDEVIQSLRPKWKNTGIDVINQCPANISLYTHPGAIYQTLSNLILNSLNHAFDNTQKGLITIDGQADNKNIYLQVYDNGNGVAPENKKRLFDPFFTTKRGAGGSGLGLHIVYNLITSTLKGKISLNDETQTGAAFDITLPILEEEAA